MKVSAKAEYACLAMLELAASYREPQPLRLKAIAEAHGISHRFLVLILLQLKSAGLVASTRGAAGGYHLAKPPEQISLADVIEAIDHEPARTSAVGTVRTPAMHALRAAWQDAHTAERRVLRALTLAELVRRMQQSDELSYQI